MSIVLYLFCAVTVLASIGVVFAKEPVLSAFSLVLSFFGLAGIYLILGHPLIAALQILIYTGAIVVLFVFVVMLLRIESAEANRFSTKKAKIAVSFFACWLVALTLLQYLWKHRFIPNTAQTIPTMREIALKLFTEYLWPFEVLSVFMLAMIVGIYIVARPFDSEDSSS